MKENKIEKLILDLSNRWECTPQEAVDRLNSMNESEINKLIKSMIKKFQYGGFIDCLRKGGTIPTCKCGEKIKAQDGTKLSRTDALNMLRTTGSTNKESRQEYRAAKRDVRSSGLRGNEMRQAARSASMQRGLDRMLPAFDEIVVEDEPIVINDNPFTNLDTSVPTVQKIDRFGGNFNSAFAAAKRNGLDKFYWTDPTGKNSGWKTTELGKSTPTQGTVEVTSTPTVVREAIIPKKAPVMVAYPSTRKAYVGNPEYNTLVYKPNVEYGYPHNPSFVNENNSISNGTANTSQPIVEEATVVETPKRRTFLSQLWDPHPEALPTHDRYAANKQRTREFLDRYSPKAKARK